MTEGKARAILDVAPEPAAGGIPNLGCSVAWNK
jgi:hypothetical protein